MLDQILVSLFKMRELSGSNLSRGPYVLTEGSPYFHQSIQKDNRNKQEVLGRTDRLLSLIQDWPHWKPCVQQFFYRCVCVRYRGNVSTEQLSSNDKGIFTEPLPSNGMGERHTHTQTATWSPKPTLFLAYFLYSKKYSVCLWFPLSSLGNGSVETLPR
jgi:hypothetical protein